jgi:folate-dependent phosphoribosylglycinamide formyltransferase PurN
MAYAPLGIVASGSFVEKEHGKTFEYVVNPKFVLHTPAHGGKNVHFPHLIFVGPRGEDTRMALVKGSVVHVVTDETDIGFVVEKWYVKDHRKYAK